MDHTAILLALFFIFVAAQIGAEVAQRLKLPSVVGEIAAGCLIGPSVLGLVHLSEHTKEPLLMMSEIGAVLLLFSVGLETRLDDLKKVGKVAFQVAIAGIILPFLIGIAWAIFQFPVGKSLFIAAAFVATSAGITARVLSDLGVLGRIESRVILGAAVIDDILAMLLLAIVTPLASSGGFSLWNFVTTLFLALSFVVLVALVGTRVIKKQSAALDAPIGPFSPLTIALAVCLGLAALAAKLGLAAIIGAFLAGMVFAEAPHRHTLERQIQVIMAFITPFFFVITGMQIELGQLASLGAVGTLLLITALAVASKFFACSWGARSLGQKSAQIVGMGMVPRGEVGIIVASLGKQSGVFSDLVYALIIAMSLLTSIIAPPILKKQLAGLPKEPDDDHGSELHRVEATGHG